MTVSVVSGTMTGPKNKNKPPILDVEVSYVGLLRLSSEVFE